MDIKNEMLWRIYVVTLLMVVFAFIIFGKVIQIQVVEGKKWQEEKQKQHISNQPVFAERGNILTEDGSLLATSLPYYNLYMDTNAPSDKDFEKYIDTLSKCLTTIDEDRTTADFIALLRLSREVKNKYLRIKSGLSLNQIEAVKKFPLFSLGRYRGGIRVERVNKRQRPFRMLAHRTVGYVREGAQPVGLEGAFDTILKGEQGYQLMEYIGNGVYIPVNDLAEIEPKTGHDIVTTIDVNIQDIAGNALLKALKKHDAHHGCAIIMEVKTGAIRAIANIGKTRSGDYWENYNYAIGESTEPGSTFKLAAMMAMFEDGLVELDDSINIKDGRTEFYEEQMIDASIHGLDSTSVQRAFEISSNIGIAKLVNEHYNINRKGEQFIKRLKQMHLNKKTGIEIEGEGLPIIKEAFESTWSGTTLPWMAIGYEVQLTPLQILTFYNAVANDGRMMKPYLVSELIDYGRTYERYTPVVLDKRIAKKETIRKAQILLESVVENGTAKSIRSEHYKIAGKTGTAQINYQRLRPRADLKYQSSFVGYFPADKPTYSCIIVINDPKVGGFYGSEVAAPVFKEISDKCYSRKNELHVPLNDLAKPKWATAYLPDYNIGQKEEIQSILNYLQLPIVDEALTTEWTVMRAEDSTLALMPRTNVADGLVPNVMGMGLRDAIFLMENAGLSVRIRGVGKVYAQSIKAHTTVKKGQVVTLKLE